VLTVVGRVYDVVTPKGESFQAKIVDAGGGLDEVVSNRNGSWEPEPLLTTADLLMPEQEFNEWDIRRVR